MKAKKALQKLKKTITPAANSVAQNQLALLKKTSLLSSSDDTSRQTLKHELKGIANQAALCAMQELAAPLNPLLSWFNESSHSYDFSALEKPTKKGSHQPSANDASASFSVKSVGYLPLKSPPCKRCPALSNGICKCAAKKFKLSA